MGNIVTYVQTEQRCMTDRAFCAVDSLVLSELAYVNFGSAVPGVRMFAKTVPLKDLYRAELFDDMFRPTHPSVAASPKDHVIYGTQNRHALLFAAAASPRFRDIRVRFFSDAFDIEQEQQFCAVTFQLEDDTAFIAFRGTDMSIVGWKEDLNMAYLSPVPSQQAAADYLNAVGKRLSVRQKLRVGGHSKGGNLAVYAAMKSSPSVQRRVVEVYNHDGPGFRPSMLKTCEYQTIESRVRKIMPESSFVGMLLADTPNYQVVESNGFGPMQHDAFSWEVNDGDFVYAEKVTDGALYMHKTVNEWLASLPDDERRLLVDALFKIIEKTNAKSVADLSESWGKSAIKMISCYRSLDVQTKRILSQVVGALIKMSVRNLKKGKVAQEKQSDS
jgi:hypothetical protein